MAGNSATGSESAVPRVMKAVEQKLDQLPGANFSFWAWLQRKRWREVLFYLLFGIAVIATLLVVSLAMAHELGNFYEWLISWTNDGEEWTKFMRKHPAVFPPLALGLFLLVAGGFTPWRLWPPAFLSAFIIFFLGFLGGHVYWS